MCGIWDWQSTIVKDLNDSQDPKHTLFCRENAFVAIYALFSDNKCPLFTRLGGGSPKGDNVTFFYRFSYIRASLSLLKCYLKTCDRSMPASKEKRNLRLEGDLGEVGKRSCCKSTDQPEQNYYPDKKSFEIFKII